MWCDLATVLLTIEQATTLRYDFSQVSITENVEPGDRITTLRASDKDSNLFGSEGIRFMDITGTIR